MRHDCWPWNVLVRCPFCGLRHQPVWGEDRYEVCDLDGQRYLRYTCPNCGRYCLDFEAEHRAPAPERGGTPVPEWFWLACAALVLVLLFMWFAVHAGY